MRHKVKTLRRKVNTLRRKVNTMRRIVKTMRRDVKTMRRKVMTMRRNVKTMRINVKTMRRRNASNMTVFEAFYQRYILTDHIFIIKKNMSKIPCESIILATYEVNGYVKNLKTTKF